MRKKIIEHEKNQDISEKDHQWLNLQELASIELTSEDDEHPIESAFVPDSGSGWKAATAGEQKLRLMFDAPQRIRLIRILFLEAGQARTQEFVLRWSSDEGHTFQDIARQQYNFSFPDSTRELEDYFVDLHEVTTLELSITPDISGGSARASLDEWSVA